MVRRKGGQSRKERAGSSDGSEVRTIALKRYIRILLAFWTVFVGVVLLWSLLHQKRDAMEVAHMHAQSAFEKDMVYRRWAAGHGGVYVPATEQTPPNPYLSHIKERDVTMPSGRVLTLVNPAYMTRKVHELGARQYGLRSHITSLDPICPENAADSWEQQALEAFERGELEVSSIEELNGVAHMRLMRPMITEKSCLKCHDGQGYKEGSLHGGISVSVPMAPLWAIARRRDITLILGYGLLWLLGFSGITLGSRRLKSRIREHEEAQQQIREQGVFLRTTIDSLNYPYYVVDANDYTVTMANRAATDTMALEKGITCYALTHRSERPCAGEGHRCPVEEIKKTNKPVVMEHTHVDKDGNERIVEIHGYPILDKQGEVRQVIEYCLDVTERKGVEKELQKALAESQQRGKEIAALLEGSRAVLKHRNFQDAARHIYNFCKQLIGATAGYVALLSADGTNNEVLFLDSGGLSCKVDPDLLMPVRGLRGQVYQSGKVMYDNDFAHNKWAQLMPKGHVSLRNVLFAPLIAEGQVIGLLGLANKPEGFTENDARMASAFGELASIALLNSRAGEAIRDVAKFPGENPNPVLRINRAGIIIYANESSKPLLKEWGCQVNQVMPSKWYSFVQKALDIGRVQQAEARCGDRMFSLTFAPPANSDYVNIYALDITKRKWAEDAVREARNVLEKRVQERTEELLRYQRQLQSMALELTLAEEQQRRSIAEGLHDQVGQLLTAANMKLEYLEGSSSSAVSDSTLAPARELIQEAIKYTRSLTFELSPPRLYTLGFEAALKWLAEQMDEQYSIRCDFEDDGQPKPMADAVKVLLYRIVRELLHNIVKHAAARKARLSLSIVGDNMQIIVEDDGVGFDLSEVESDSGRGGFGLFSVRERLNYLKGNLAIRSGSGQGTQIIVTVPLNPSAQEKEG